MGWRMGGISVTPVLHWRTLENLEGFDKLIVDLKSVMGQNQTKWKKIVRNARQSSSKEGHGEVQETFN